MANIVATITTVAEGDDDKALAVQQAIKTMEAGATPGEAKEALKNWKDYETHKAMWRPDENRAGLPGASALKRPWGEVAKDLAGGFQGHSLPAVAANSASDFNVYPGTSEGMMGQSGWMFPDSDSDIIEIN